MTTTTEATFADCVTSAKDYIERSAPSTYETPEARWFYHAMMDYFYRLGVPSTERSEIIRMWVEAVQSTDRAAWHRGYTAGLQSGKRIYAPPF